MKGNYGAAIMYGIYKITSPSEKSYIGLTKSSIQERWRQHKRRAFDEDRNHPFYNAIRKYGPNSFKVELLDTAPNKPAAQKLERFYIAQQPLELSYNISPGGEADGEAGGRIFWDKMAANPGLKEQYVKKLSDIKRASDWSDYEALSQKAAQWRKDNPREAYKASRRALRIANKTKAKARIGAKKEEDTRLLKEKLLWKHKRSVKTRENAFALWERRTKAQKEEIATKISGKAKTRWESIQDPEERARITADARKAVDRKKQGPAASRGLKSFWEDLRKDPEQYKAYIEQRKATLKRTLERKKGK